MEISPMSSSETETVYVCSLVAIASLYLIAAFCAIQTTEFSNSVPPLVMFQLRYCLFLFTYYSTRGFLVLPSQSDQEPDAVVDYAVKFFHLVFFLVSCLSVIAIRHFPPGGACIFIILLPLFLYYQRCFRSHWMNLLRRVLKSSSINPFATWLQIYMSKHGKINFSLPPTSAAAATDQERNGSIFSRNEKIVETIKFAVGILTGTILFQNYFSLNSFEEILPFLYIAVVWLAGITLLSVSNDFGIFNFILGDVMVGSMVAETGLGAHTWLAFAASLLLYRLRLELKSLPLAHGRVDSTVQFVNIILIIIVYYGAYLVLFVYRPYILSDPRPLFDRQLTLCNMFCYNSILLEFFFYTCTYFWF